MTNATGSMPYLCSRNSKRLERRRLLMRLALVGIVGVGCSLDGVLQSADLPPDVTDPAITRTPEGARAVYHSAVALFRAAYGGRLIPSALGLPAGDAQSSFIGNTGLLSDELQSSRLFGFGAAAPVDPEDVRNLPQSGSDQFSHYAHTFSRLQRVRGQAGQALGFLSRYLSDQPALAGHVYALQGYAEVFLAELFCSGIPLSTIDYDGDYTLRPGLSTDKVLEHAVSLFDSALVLSGDSARFLNLARVGKARALLGLGQYAAAAAAVAAVPDAYSYLATYAATGPTAAPNFAAITDAASVWPFTVSDREGVNGLDYRTSGDPRVQVTVQATGTDGTPVWYPQKYLVGTSTNGASPIMVASGIEGRLIEAEAALQAGDAAWLTKLNALRTDGTFEVTATTPPDTLWHAGSGGVARLAPLADPGASLSDPTAAKNARVDLLFRERAFWLFLTGHRQGDLRRLIRQYGRLQEHVYPTGPYPGLTIYGSDVTVPVPVTERISNPQFTGCISRTA